MNKKLGDIAFITKLAGFEHTNYIQGNCTHTKQRATDLPLFIGKTIRNGKIDKNYDWYISKDISDSLIRSKLTKKCLVIPYVGSVGDLAIFDGKYEAHLGSNVAKVELNDNCGYTEEFLYYFLKSPYGQKILLKDIQGAVQKNITMEAIRNVILPEISIDEQKKIVRLLESFDKKIDNNLEINSILEKTIKTIFDYWFLQFNYPNKDGKPYKDYGGELYWNDELKKEIPKGWNVANIEDFCRVFTGKKDVNSALERGQYKFYSCAPDYKYSNDLIYDGKAILISGNGSYTGRTIFVNDKFDLYQRTYACVNKENNDFLEYIFYSMIKFFVPKVSGGTHGSAIPYIVYNDIAKQKILYNDEIVSLFQKRIEPMNDIILKNMKQNEILLSMKNYFLPLLINGQVKIN